MLFCQWKVRCLNVTKKILLLPVTSDFIFKLIFGDQRNVDILAAFLRAVLDIPDEEYDRLVIVDPHIKKESVDDKYGILDVKIHTVRGGVIHVEIQNQVLPDMKARTIYSQSKLVTEQISSGMKWSSIKRAITIVITNDVFVPEGDKYHHQFRYRTDEGIEFTDLSVLSSLSSISSITFEISLLKSAAFLEVITGLPVSASIVFRASPATLPPRLKRLCFWRGISKKERCQFPCALLHIQRTFYD